MLAPRISVIGALVMAAPGLLPGQNNRERDAGRQPPLSRRIEQTIDASLASAMLALEDALQNMDWAWTDSHQGVSRIDTTFAFPSDGTVDLSGFDADITVTGWTRAEARVVARTERGNLRYRFSRSRISLEAEGRRGRGDARFELHVPTGVHVILRSSSGDLNVTGTGGSVEARSSSGDVTVSGAGDRVEVSSLSGSVTVRSMTGEVDASSLGGDVYLRDVKARRIRGESTSGDVELTNVTSADIDASSVSGDILFTGPIDPRGTYSFASHAGDVTLTVPAGISARIGVETFNGELDSDFPITLQSGSDRRTIERMEFSIGAGDARVIVESFSGDINIRRQKRP